MPLKDFMVYGYSDRLNIAEIDTIEAEDFATACWMAQKLWPECTARALQSGEKLPLAFTEVRSRILTDDDIREMAAEDAWENERAEQAFEEMIAAGGSVACCVGDEIPF